MGQIFLCSLDKRENVILRVFLIFPTAFFIKKLPAHTKVETKLVSWIYFERVRGSEGWDPRDRETPLLLLTLRSWDTFSFMVIKLPLAHNLRIQPFLLAPRRQWRFARRNVCDWATEIPYWWRKICPESGQELWLVDIVVILFYLLFTNDRQKAT